MKTHIIALTATLALCVFLSPPTQNSALATQVTVRQALADAAGARAWEEVSRVEFTWTHHKKKLSRSYIWERDKERVTVTLDTRAPKEQVTIDLTSAEDRQTTAYKAFINDSYWGFFSLYVGADSNVNVTQLGVGGKLYGGATRAIDVKYGDVGHTPGDRYILHTDEGFVPLAWLYYPGGQDSPKLITTRSSYISSGGVSIPTSFKAIDADGSPGDEIISISGVSIQ